MMMQLTRCGMTLFLALVIAGCGTADERVSSVPAEPSATTNYLSVPPSTEEAVFPKFPPAATLTLIAGDFLHITVFRQKDLELEVRIPEGGSFAYPLIGDVQATGKTVKTVELDLRKRLEDKYLYRAGVTVTVKE